MIVSGNFFCFYLELSLVYLLMCSLTFLEESGFVLFLGLIIVIFLDFELLREFDVVLLDPIEQRDASYKFIICHQKNLSPQIIIIFSSSCIMEMQRINLHILSFFSTFLKDKFNEITLFNVLLDQENDFNNQNYINIYQYVRRMEEHAISPQTIQLNTQTSGKQNKKLAKPQPQMNKYNSQPKIRSYKQQILKIPKVKQILNKDKYVYCQDIQKRLQLIGTLKNDNYQQQQLADLHDLRKNVIKKNKRHKTNFKIPLTRKNVQSLNNLVLQHISHNQRYKNQQVIFLKQYTENAPFDLEQLKFMDKLDQVKVKFSQKYPELNQRVLSKNKLTLENVILNRNIKRQIQLDKKRQQKVHSKKVFSSMSTAHKPNLIVKQGKKTINKTGKD